MQLGIMIEAHKGLPWGAWREISRKVEELGFESLWCSDHFLSWSGKRSRPTLEAWCLLTYLGLTSSHIRFGPLVCSVTFRHPALLARMAAAVDQLSNGRLELGLGIGWYEEEHRKYGLPFPSRRVRTEMLEESIQAIRGMWSEGIVSFSGKLYQLDNVEANPKPLQRPNIPLIVGGTGDQILKIAAYFADEWNFFSLSLESYRDRRRLLEGYCAEVERDPSSIRCSRLGGYLIGENRWGVLSRAWRLQIQHPQLAGMDEETLLAHLEQSGWMIGTPQEIVYQIDQFAEGGVQRVMLIHSDLEDMHALHLLAEGVLPNVQN